MSVERNQGLPTSAEFRRGFLDAKVDSPTFIGAYELWSALCDDGTSTGGRWLDDALTYAARLDLTGRGL